jgi:predicted ATP-dependent Lon-type protease
LYICSREQQNAIQEKLTELAKREAEVYRTAFEVGCSPRTGKLRIAGGIDGTMKESIQRAFAYLAAQKAKIGISQQMDTTDFHVEGIDLRGKYQFSVFEGAFRGWVIMVHHRIIPVLSIDL